jgi:hypothetical protein
VAAQEGASGARTQVAKREEEQYQEQMLQHFTEVLGEQLKKDIQ